MLHDIALSIGIAVVTCTSYQLELLHPFPLCETRLMQYSICLLAWSSIQSFLLSPILLAPILPSMLCDVVISC